MEYLNTTYLFLLGITVANYFIFKATQKVEFKKTGITHANPIGVAMIFLGPLGTLLLLAILTIESGFFDYKNK